MFAETERLGPVALYRHDHPPVRDVLAEHDKELSPGQRIADRVVAAVGSWPFIIVQSALLTAWISLNVYLVVIAKTHPGFLSTWDPYPFILLNLVLSFQAAYTGPVVMMSQNRAAEKDRLLARHDFEVNSTCEREIQVVMNHLAHQDCLLIEAVERLERQRQGEVETAPAARMDEIPRRLEEHDRRLLELTAKVDAASRPPRGPTPGYGALREAGSPDPDTSLTEAWENEGGGTGVPAPQRSGA